MEESTRGARREEGADRASPSQAYRGKNGSYTTNKKHRPIFYGEFVASEPHRRRCASVSPRSKRPGADASATDWARSYLGYPPVRQAEPNPTHYAIAALQKMGLVNNLITQVSRLSFPCSTLADRLLPERRWTTPQSLGRESQRLPLPSSPLSRLPRSSPSRDSPSDSRAPRNSATRTLPFLRYSSRARCIPGQAEVGRAVWGVKGDC